MKKKVIVAIALCAIGALAMVAQADMKEKFDAKAEFDKHCGSCHAKGGNRVNPAKTLNKAALERNGVKNWQDGVAKMRNPGPGMTKFMKKDISDTKAKAISKYVLATFQY